MAFHHTHPNTTNVEIARKALEVSAVTGIDAETLFLFFVDGEELGVEIDFDVYPDECQCCGYWEEFIVGPKGRYCLGGQSGPLP